MSLLANSEQSHAHSQQTLNALYEYDDFMESIATMVDLGCGTGLDLEWWATRTTRDDNPQPLDIKCTGVDVLDQLSIARQYPNITYQKTDFEGTIHTPVKNKFDILWSHDSFQYAINPIATLSNWWNIASDGGMLAVIVPQTTSKHGFFSKNPRDPWLHAIVYKSNIAPQDPKKTTWYTLSELGLLPDSADRSIYAHGELRQQDLVLPWLDHSLMSMAQQ
jgi:trans-aconitate methyltransferase